MEAPWVTMATLRAHWYNKHSRYTGTSLINIPVTGALSLRYSYAMLHGIGSYL